MSWKVGDIAICITPGSRIKGFEVTIISALHPADSHKKELNGRPVYTIDTGLPVPLDISAWVARPQYLIPLPPANEITTWDESIFKPKELVT